VQQGGEEAGAGGAEGVAERDRAAGYVHLGQVGAGLALPGQHDRGERLVDLDQVDVVHGQAGFVQGVGGGGDRGGEHHDGVVAAGGQVADPGSGLEVVLTDGALGGDQQGGGAVGDLAGQGGGDPATLAQRLEPGHLLQGGVGARALVFADAVVGGDLPGEVAVLDGAQRALVAGQGVALHLGAADVPLLGDHVGRPELGDLLGAVAGPPADRADERVAGNGHSHRGADRDHAHVLHAARDYEIRGAAEHGLGGEVHRLLGRAALPVHGDAGHRLGQARGQPGGAGDVAGLRPDRVHAAEHHVVDLLRIRVRAVEHGLDDVRAQVSRVRPGQAAAAAGDRRADGFDEVGLGHPCLPRVE
jgi:hypothetical protein